PRSERGAAAGGRGSKPLAHTGDCTAQEPGPKPGFWFWPRHIGDCDHASRDLAHLSLCDWRCMLLIIACIIPWDAL
ncbi:hypothetical protein, partial [Bradyrhizobium acaciae]|uniref:hypothetical protein n=1 Tax=Bradyrhizobium acaciae TaxID=2683706 RepID=UPI001E5765C3